MNTKLFFMIFPDIEVHKVCISNAAVVVFPTREESTSTVKLTFVMDSKTFKCHQEWYKRP